MDTLQMILTEIQNIPDPLNNSVFSVAWDFWIKVILSLIAIGISFFSLRAALKAKTEAHSAKTEAIAAKNAAKEAAVEAGRTIKIQTITIEISELIQNLDSLEQNLSFKTARDLHNNLNRRIRRIIAPFKNEIEYSTKISEILIILNNLKESLETVKPVDQEVQILGNMIYNATEGYFSELSGELAELMGLFEKRTIEIN